MDLGQKNISDSQRGITRNQSNESTASKKGTAATQLYLGFFLILLISVVSSCGSSKKIIEERSAALSEFKEIQAVSTSKPKNTEQIPEKKLTNKEKIQNYIQVFKPFALQEMKAYGIPASITMAQGILESGMGEGRLALEANNHFGIKCHQAWEGARIYHDDDEKGECFRVYTTPQHSFRDHSVFLKNRSRYAFLFELSATDYKAWAKGLKKAGYATDPHYPDKLISLIERFNLAQLDEDTRVKPKKNKRNRVLTHTVQKGDTLYSLSKLYQVSVAQLIKRNKIKEQKIYLGQSLIIPTNP